MAHDNKRRAACLLNRCAASSRPDSSQQNACCDFAVQSGLAAAFAVGAEVRIRFDRIQGVTVCRIFDETLGELRVTQAYIELLSIPEKGAGTRSIPIIRTGNYEIRIFRLSQNGSDSEPAIWMVLFDHGTRLPVDTGRCREIEDAMVVFKEFVAQIKSL